MIKNWINPFISFRSRLLIFVTLIVLTTISAIYFISRHLERRIAGLVAEHIKAISVSVDLAQSSSFFAQDTPPINASFWVERNARPLSQVKHIRGRWTIARDLF